MQQVVLLRYKFTSSGDLILHSVSKGFELKMSIYLKCWKACIVIAIRCQRKASLQINC